MTMEVVPGYRRNGLVGAYSVSALSGTMAAGLSANSEILQFRWAPASTDLQSRRAVIHSVTLDGLAGSATAFAAGFAKVDMMASRANTAAGSGGSALTLTTNNGKLRTSPYATTVVGEIRVATTGALTAATQTLDANPCGIFSFSTGTVASVIYVPQKVYLFDERDAGQQPLILAHQEGFVLRATVPATGTWQWAATVRWSEMDNH